MKIYFFQSPPKGATIPYRPKPNVAGPVILAGGQAYTIQGNYAVPAQDVSCLCSALLFLEYIIYELKIDKSFHSHYL